MKKVLWNGAALLGAIAVFSLAFFAGCPTGTDDDPQPGPATTIDPLGLVSVTINGAVVDIGFKGTAGWAGSEGWGFNSNGAQNGGIYSAASEADLAAVTVLATPQDSGATVKYAVVHYTGEHPGTGAGTDPEYESPADDAYAASGAFTNLSDMDYIAVEVSKGETKAWYKFRVAVDAPLLGENGVSAGGTKLGWTIPDLDWTHNQGAFFHNNVGPNPDQSIGLILQDTLPLDGKSLAVDVPTGATATWAILTTGNNNTGVILPNGTTWNATSAALPTIASGSLLSIRVQKGTKTLYYNWWVYKKPDIKLSSLSVAGNAADTAKLVAFTDTWSGAAIQEIIVPVEDTSAVLESAKINWGEPLGLAIAVTSEEPAADDWQGTSRGQNDNHQIVVQPPAVDLNNNDILSIRARISDKVWYYRAKIVFRGLQDSDADLTGLTIGSGPTAITVTNFGTAAATVQAATAGQALNLNLSQATNAVIAPVGGPNAEFLFTRGDGTMTPAAGAGWLNSGTLSFDTGDYLLIQAFAGELDSKYYKFPVTVTYPAADDVKLDTLTIGGAAIAATNFGAPWVGSTIGTAGAVEITEAQNNAAINGTVPAAAAGSTVKFGRAINGVEPTEWKEVTGSGFSAVYPTFEFATTGDQLWIQVAAGTQTVKIYKIAITVKSWTEADAKLDSLIINGDFNFTNFSYGYTVIVTVGNPGGDIGSLTASAFSVEAGKTTGFGPGLYVNAVANSGATIEFAKTTGGAPVAWVPASGTMGPATFEFANNDVFWVRVTAGTFVKYYKFTVTVTQP
jgi:hypothetical protein